MIASHFETALEGALHMFRLGNKVFPIRPNEKTPAVTGWKEWAEQADERRIREYGAAHPETNWAVSCGPSGLCVLDVDNKNGVKGSVSLACLELSYSDLPNTFKVATPSGGFHYYFFGIGKNTTGVIDDGVDTKSVGGYVLAPGSRINGKRYEIENAASFAPWPEWLHSLTIKKERTPANAPSEAVFVEEGERNQSLASLAGTMRNRGMGYEAILAGLKAFNAKQVTKPLPEQEVESIARSISKYPPAEAKAAADFIEPVKLQAHLAGNIDFDAIKPRDWIMKERYIGGFVSLIVSPGGVGKSAATMLDAVSVASERSLSGFPITKSGAVWLYNTEDPPDELERRLAAISLHHRIDYKEIKHNIHFTSGRDQPLILVKNDQTGIVINQEAINGTIEYIRNHNIVLMIVDPFVRTHAGEENDNTVMDKVVFCFQKIADLTGCAIGLVHHANKAGSGSNADPGDMNIARGATSIICAARIIHTLTTMTDNEAKKFGIPKEERHWYMRLDNAKANMQPPAECTNWYKKISITLPNGDNVGTIEKAILIDAEATKKNERKESEKQDLAVCLSELFPKDGTKSLAEVNQFVFENDRFKHLFSSSKNLAHRKEKLKKALSDGVAHKDKEYSLQDLKAGKPRYFVKCQNFFEC